jgi:hypothetical protein
MKPPKLVNCRICPDITAPEDSIEGMFHKGIRKFDSEQVAFYYQKKWWAALSDFTVAGPFKSKEEALG